VRLTTLAGNFDLLFTDVRLQDPGARELRYVFTASSDSIDVALIDEGLAIA
jgi:endonuclease YncB( thermonuclease family)